MLFTPDENDICSYTQPLFAESSVFGEDLVLEGGETTKAATDFVSLRKKGTLKKKLGATLGAAARDGHGTELSPIVEGRAEEECDDHDSAFSFETRGANADSEEAPNGPRKGRRRGQARGARAREKNAGSASTDCTAASAVHSRAGPCPVVDENTVDSGEDGGLRNRKRVRGHDTDSLNDTKRSCTATKSEAVKSETPGAGATRELGKDASKEDREDTTFSDTNSFIPHEIVIVPRTKERLHYAKVFKVSEGSPPSVTVMLGPGNTGAPLTKILPAVLVGQMNASRQEQAGADESVNMAKQAKSVILTLEGLYTFLKGFKQPSPNVSPAAGQQDETKRALSPALYEHSMFLVVYHARRLYYCCKLFETQTKALSQKLKRARNVRQDPSTSAKESPTTSDAGSSENSPSVEIESSASLVEMVHKLEEENRDLVTEKEKLLDEISRLKSVADAQESSDNRIPQYRSTIRQKDEAIRKLQKSLRGKEREKMELLEEVREKIEMIFKLELKEEDISVTEKSD